MGDEAAHWARKLTETLLLHRQMPALTADRVDDANLVVSELVTNATRHGRGECRLRLRAGGRRVTVEVHDDSPHWPRVRPIAELAENGRGLAIVRLLARRLSVTGDVGGGKTVRAVLATAYR
ncbi:ATP-binding protein [Streptomyces sp. NPDC056149]|uniref:ATP-binding protein n=1 Tax=Streptomyces sp. NPDC056149 TaxID=3345728 RepID=UPI0035E066D7